jgi:hypothetical protein
MQHPRVRARNMGAGQLSAGLLLPRHCPFDNDNAAAYLHFSILFACCLLSRCRSKSHARCFYFNAQRPAAGANFARAPLPGAINSASHRVAVELCCCKDSVCCREFESCLHLQVCERLVDSSMSHGASVKMIIEYFNAALPPHLRRLFKPSASIQPPPQTPLSFSRPATAVSAAAVSGMSMSTLCAEDSQQRPFSSRTRPSTSYSDAGDARWCIAALVYCSVGVLQRWCIAALVYCSVGVLQRWCIAALVYCSVGVLQRWCIVMVRRGTRGRFCRAVYARDNHQAEGSTLVSSSLLLFFYRQAAAAVAAASLGYFYFPTRHQGSMTVGKYRRLLSQAAFLYRHAQSIAPLFSTTDLCQCYSDVSAMQRKLV